MRIFKFISIVLFSFLICLLTGCVPDNKSSGTYEQITPEQAKAIMDKGLDIIILDVRTEEEFAQGHIKDAILIPDYEIETKAESMLHNKKQLILVYCRSGRRSKLAAQTLVDMGYTNVKEFGGIIDWKYEIII